MARRSSHQNPTLKRPLCGRCGSPPNHPRTRGGKGQDQYVTCSNAHCTRTHGQTGEHSITGNEALDRFVRCEGCDTVPLWGAPDVRICGCDGEPAGLDEVTTVLARALEADFE